MGFAGTIGATGGPAGDGVPTAEGSADLDGTAPATGNGVVDDKVRDPALLVWLLCFQPGSIFSGVPAACSTLSAMLCLPPEPMQDALYAIASDQVAGAYRCL